jgi:hypothetical protein
MRTTARARGAARPVYVADGAMSIEKVDNPRSDGSRSRLVVDGDAPVGWRCGSHGCGREGFRPTGHPRCRCPSDAPRRRPTDPHARGQAGRATRTGVLAAWPDQCAQRRGEPRHRHDRQTASGARTQCTQSSDRARCGRDPSRWSGLGGCWCRAGKAVGVYLRRYKLSREGFTP